MLFHFYFLLILNFVSKIKNGILFLLVMDYKYIKKNDDIYTTQSVVSNKKYQKILDNLLDISSRGDSAVFTKLNTYNKILNNLISEKEIEKIYSNYEFRIKLKNGIKESDFNFLEKISDADQFINFCKKNSINLSQVLEKKLNNDFKNNRNEAIEKIRIYNNSFIARWKKIIKHTNDVYNQTNIWPLFVGFYFLEANLVAKKIRAPFILKEIEIIYENNNIYLCSRNSNLVFNDKLTFFLEEHFHLQMPVLDQSIDKISIENVTNELDYYFANTFELPFIDIQTPFEEKNIQLITKEIVVKVPGFVLINCQPTGGNLRRATLDIINSNKIDHVLENKNDLFDYQSASINYLLKDRKKIARICPTDASQEKAIIASLEANSIIIGPPGTGKSQTIANILANIIKNDKKALLISQKKVALEVVIERMKNLKYFMFQMVESNKKATKNDKAEFYQNLQTFRFLIQKEEEYKTSKELSSFVDVYKTKKWLLQSKMENIIDFQINSYIYFKIRYEIISLEQIREIFELNDLIKNISNNNFNLIFVLNNRPKKINELAFCLKIEKEKKFVLFKSYPKLLKQILIELRKIYLIIEEYKILIKDIEQLLNIKSFIKYSSIDEAFNYFISNEFINSENAKSNFISDEKMLLNIAKKWARNRVEIVNQKAKNKDKNFLKKFLGRIERGFTVPSNFTNLFKKELKQMFNIIISTPESLSNFIDFKKDHFDYVIFDEASQIFLEKAIPYLAIADVAIIAGDEQQMQPSNWFNTRSNDYDEDLEENIDSLLTFAISNNIPRYFLELNYRASFSSLSTFSAKEFYESNLKCLDKNNVGNTSIEIINIDGEWIDNHNEKEARQAILILKQNINRYEKIILLTLNKNQSDFIENILAEEEVEIYNLILENKIILKNLENIQGDEADLVIISVSYDKNTMLSGTYVGRKGGRNALNVAITRAKEKMIILKSIYANQVRISNQDNLDLNTFKRWLQFLDLSEKEQKEYSLVENINNKSVESNFENDVLKWLKTFSFVLELEIITQYPVGSYRIDLAILDKRSKKFIVGIEIDGLRYHSQALKRYNDLVRQNFIEAKGYSIIRISEALWKSDRDKIIDLLRKYIK